MLFSFQTSRASSQHILLVSWETARVVHKYVHRGQQSPAAVHTGKFYFLLALNEGKSKQCYVSDEMLSLLDKWIQGNNDLANNFTVSNTRQLFVQRDTLNTLFFINLKQILS